VSTLWRGCAPNVSRGIIITGVELPVYDTAKRFLLRNGLKDNPTTHIIASLATAVCASIAISPADVIKTRMMNSQINQYKSPLDCIRTTWNRDGIRGFYKGVHIVFSRLAPHNLIAWVTMEQITQFCERNIKQHNNK